MLRPATLVSILSVSATVAGSPTCASGDDVDDCAALTAFYSCTSPKLPWGVGSLCDWEGVSCNSDGRVDILDVHNRQVSC